MAISPPLLAALRSCLYEYEDFFGHGPGFELWGTIGGSWVLLHDGRLFAQSFDPIEAGIEEVLEITDPPERFTHIRWTARRIPEMLELLPDLTVTVPCPVCDGSLEVRGRFHVCRHCGGLGRVAPAETPA